MQRGTGNFGQHGKFVAPQVAGPKPYGQLQKTTLNVQIDSRTGSYGHPPAPLTPGLALPDTYLRKMSNADMLSASREPMPVAVTPMAPYSAFTTMRLDNVAAKDSENIPYDSVADAGYGGAPGDECGSSPNASYPESGPVPQIIQAPAPWAPQNPIPRGSPQPSRSAPLLPVKSQRISALGDAGDVEPCCASCAQGLPCAAALGDFSATVSGLSAGEKAMLGLGAAYLLWRWTR